MRKLRGGAAALALAVGWTLFTGAARPAAALGPSTEDTRDFGIGIHLGSSVGLSAKYWLGTSLALNLNAGLNRWWARGTGLRVEVDGVWHWQVARFEVADMLIGPGAGLGIGWWRNSGGLDLCGDREDLDTPEGLRASCFGPFLRGLFHWSMLFHDWNFDVFAEPGLSLVLAIPGRVGLDLDLLFGARYYF